MPRVNPRNIDSFLKMKYLDVLWTAIAGLKNRNEVKNFFKDLLSESEAVMLGRRILIAKMLIEGRTYDEIVNQLNVGLDTVSKVQQWLTSGFGGYEKGISKLQAELAYRQEIERKRNLQPYSFEWLKNKYPLHFLLFNLFDKPAGPYRTYKKSKRKML